LELDDVRQTLPEPTEQVSRHVALIGWRNAVIERWLVKGCDRAFLQIGETLPNFMFIFHLIVEPEMILHLRMDGASDLRLVKGEQSPGLFFRKIGRKVSNDLPGKVVEQIGMLIVGDVGNVDHPLTT
jgi:hypothetical protein